LSKPLNLKTGRPSRYRFGRAARRGTCCREKVARFDLLDEFGDEVLLAGCAPNAASLKKLEQLSKRRTQTGLLIF